MSIGTGADGGAPQPDPSWRAIINDWVRDSEIRRDGLKAFGATLATVVLVVWIAFAGGTTVLSHLLGQVLSTTLGQIITAGTVAFGIGEGLWHRHRRRRRAPAVPGALGLASAPDDDEPDTDPNHSAA